MERAGQSCCIRTPIGLMEACTDGGRLTILRFLENRTPTAGSPGQQGCDDPLLTEVHRQLSAYFSGRLRSFDLPLAPEGTTFQSAVWLALREVPYGETIGYGALAGQVAARQGGTPPAARAVGGALGRNPIAIIVPCHRVIGADGSLTGYAGGLDRKAALLELERTCRPH